MLNIFFPLRKESMAFFLSWQLDILNSSNCLEKIKFQCLDKKRKRTACFSGPVLYRENVYFLECVNKDLIGVGR